MTDPLASRVERVLAGFADANRRLVARLESASETEAITTPVAGGWTPAQIGAHVATFNAILAGYVSGARPGARPAPVEFVERPWAEIQATLTGPFSAPQHLEPQGDTTGAASLAALAAAADQVAAAFSDLTVDRADLTISHPRVGAITLLQAGDWIVAHTIRHNAQMKRVLGR
jgi:uncharacterized damage-inducible protein DinB